MSFWHQVRANWVRFWPRGITWEKKNGNFLTCFLTFLFSNRIPLNSVIKPKSKCYKRLLLQIFFERLRDWDILNKTFNNFFRAQFTKRFFLVMVWCIYTQSLRFLGQFWKIFEFLLSVFVETAFTRFCVISLLRLWAFQKPLKSIRWACGNLFRSKNYENRLINERVISVFIMRHQLLCFSSKFF